MKKTRLFLAASLLAIGSLSTVTMTSCSKDDKICPTGYEGDDCDIESRAKFVKTWNATDVPPSGSQILYTCPIANGAAITSVVISNKFSDDFFESNINATIDGNKITIPQQTPDSGGDYKVSGSGTYVNGEIQWDYILMETSTGDDQTYTGVWK